MDFDLKENPNFKVGNGSRLYCPEGIQAIYIIYHDDTGYFYIAHSKGLSWALGDDFRRLKADKHHCEKLQELYNSNTHDSFSFDYIEIQDVEDRGASVDLIKEKFHSSDLLLNKKIVKSCEFCEVDSNKEKIVSTKRFGGERSFCNTHYYQMVRHGEIKRTSNWRNEIIEHEDYLEVVLYDKNQNVTGKSMVSKHHRELIENYKWYRKPYPNRYTDYVLARDKNGKHLRLHALIAERLLGKAPDGMTVDHKNRDGLDNRDENLSYKDQTFQNYNQRMHRNNKSGVKGVSWSNLGSGYWAAQLRYKNIKLHKHFKIFEDAVATRTYWESLIESDRIDMLEKELSR